MPTPTVITDLSQTAALNYPAGTDSPSVLDDVQRAHASFLALIRDGKGLTAAKTLVGAATTDIGGENSMAVMVTGTPTITSLGANYNGPRIVWFTGIATITHNATLIDLPGGVNITTAAGDAMIAVPNSTGNGWKVVSFLRGAIASDYLNTTRIDVASAGTVSLTASAPNTRNINITGTTSITAFTVSIGQLYFVRFNAALTLTNNANIVTQTGASINTATGDTCIIRATAANVVEVICYVPSTPGSTQIQPLAAVANTPANSVTISCGVLSLDFRSETLGSGTVTRVTGAPANLVISSGSTLGTVNGVQCDILVRVINNAGTLELTAENLAGGMDSSETGLITTVAEGGAGAADSSTVIYSTTARTSKAYRVVGVFRCTQATAGTWVTALSLVQGAGGNALTSMQSLGYGQTWQDVTGSRATGVTYYNTTGRPILVCTTTSGTGVMQLSVNGVVVGTCSYAAGNPNAITILVPPNASYSATSGGAYTFSRWTELL